MGLMDVNGFRNHTSPPAGQLHNDELASIALQRVRILKVDGAGGDLLVVWRP